MACKGFITSLKSDKPVYKLVSSRIVGTQYSYLKTYRTEKTQISVALRPSGLRTSSHSNTLYALHMLVLPLFCHYCLLVANTINFSLAIYFVLLFFYSQLARPVIQLFTL